MDIITKLQDPQLVADFQSYLGVQRLDIKKKYIATNILKHSESSKDSIWGKILDEGTIGGTEGCTDNKIIAESKDNLSYVITNRFWYSLFYLATKIGDEIFYTIFFPFWYWNVDGAVLRRVLVIWMITMYIGQALKDILRIPRPQSPPVIRLDPKWCLEYGLPSTHAMVGFSIPFSLLYLSVHRYQLDWYPCFIAAFVWCLLVCASRIYLGMHTFLDIICGLALISCLMVIILPVIDAFDHFTLTHPFSPVISLMLTIAMVVCYPNTDRWTPARGDTTVIVGVGGGCLVGSWLNYQLGCIKEPDILPPYAVIWPSINMIGLSIFRTILGLLLIVIVRAIFKSLSLATICGILQASPSDYKNKTGKISHRGRLIVELFYKFITYVGIGITIMFTAPLTFRYIGIERPTYSTEM